MTSSGRCSILSAADMRLQVRVHETPSTSDTLMKVLSAILSMAPVAEAPSSRAGSARTTASPAAAKRRHKGCPQPAYGAHGNEHQRDSRHQHEVQRALRQTHAQDANEHPHQAHRSRNARKGAVDHRPALVRASTQANPLKQARQVQDILLHHTMPSPRGLVTLLDRKPARQLGYCHEHRFP